MLKDSLPHGLMVWRRGFSPTNKPWGSTHMSPVSILGETVLRVALFSLFGRSVPDVSYTFGALDQRGVGSWALYKASRRLGSEHLGPTHPSTCWRPQDPLLVKNNLVFGGLRTLTLSQNPGGPSGQSPIIGK